MNRIFVHRPSTSRPPVRAFSHPCFRLRDEAESLLREAAYVLALSRRIALDLRKPNA